MSADGGTALLSRRVDNGSNGMHGSVDHLGAIDDQLRLRDGWRTVNQLDDPSVDLRLLVSRRRELVVEQTRRFNRLRH